MSLLNVIPDVSHVVGVLLIILLIVPLLMSFAQFGTSLQRTICPTRPTSCR